LALVAALLTQRLSVLLGVLRHIASGLRKGNRTGSGGANRPVGNQLLNGRDLNVQIGDPFLICRQRLWIRGVGCDQRRSLLKERGVLTRKIAVGRKSFE